MVSRRRIGIALAASALACDPSAPNLPPAPVDRITLSPPAATIDIGGTVQFTAVLEDSQGQQLTNRLVTWESSDTFVAVVVGGSVSGRNSGITVISAHAEGKVGRGTTQVQVPIATVVVTPNAFRVVRSDSRSLRVVAIDARGDTAVSPSVSWSSSDTNVAVVSTAGLVTTVSSGTATITAISRGVSGSSTATVVVLTLTAIATGARHTCALATDGHAYCWGDNNSLQLGSGGALGPAPHPFPTVTTSGPPFAALDAGDRHTCGLTAAGAVYCWGDGASGQLGTDSAIGTINPHPVPTVSSFARIDVGGAHGCGLDAAGTAYCWGQNYFGQTGNGDSLNHGIPQPVAGGVMFRAIAAGSSHTCGVSTSGDTYCWGAANAQQLGTDSASQTCFFSIRCSTVPIRVADTLSAFFLSAGGDRTCVLTADSLAACWGAGSGAPTLVDSNLHLATITVGAAQSCGLTAGGSAYCWGDPAGGAYLIPGGLTFTSIRAGTMHICGLTLAGAAYCWGDNAFGQLGDGTRISSAAPVRVAGQP